MVLIKAHESVRNNKTTRYAMTGDSHVENGTPLFASNKTQWSDFMKQHKTLLATAIVLALGISSFAVAERPAQCDEA